MLELKIDKTELWNEQKQEFVYTEEKTLRLEHSLVSISKWESKWNTPFLSKEQKTNEQWLDYIKCMTITQNVDDLVYMCLSKKNMDDVAKYIEKSHTATTFNTKNNKPANREIVTSEIIYYWMVTLGIPFECQKWNLSRLLALIQVCNIKNQPPKKMGKKQTMSSNASLNAARRKRFNSKG